MNEINKIENEFKEKIKKFINQNSFNTWIKPVKIVSIDQDYISFQVPSKVHIDFIRGQYKTVFEQTLNEILRTDKLSLKFLIDSDSDFSITTKEETSIPKRKNISKNRMTPYRETLLNPKYTFDNFVMGNGNETAYVSSLQVAKNIKNTQYNPLLIYGGVGLGKTHLVSALGNYVFNNYPDLKVIYLTSDQFVIQIVNHIKNKTIDTYKHFLSSKDIIIIDDIQFFAKKEKSQEELFHIFNYIYNGNGQIVLTSDFHPNQIHELDDRLKSRFKMGLITDLRPVDLETRAAILRIKSEEIDFNLDDDVIMYIANNINTNIRDLEGAVKKLYFFFSHYNKDISLNKAKEILKDLISSKNTSLNIDKIQDIVSVYFDIPKDLLMKKTRTKEVAHARAVAMYLCTTQLQSTTTSIGAHFGNREHSTVSHAAGKIQKKLNLKDTEMVRTIEEILNVINLSTC